MNLPNTKKSLLKKIQSEMKALFVFTFVILCSSTFGQVDLTLKYPGLETKESKPFQKATEFLKGYYESTHIKKRFPALLGSVISGAGYGVNQTLQHHYVYFKHLFPGANDQFWDYRISWLNKYKLDGSGRPLLDEHGRRIEAFPLSTNLLVMFTDGFHLSNAISRTGRTIKATFYFTENSRQWGYRLLDAVIEFAFESITFHIVYTGPKLIYQWTK